MERFGRSLLALFEWLAALTAAEDRWQVKEGFWCIVYAFCLSLFLLVAPTPFVLVMTVIALLFLGTVATVWYRFSTNTLKRWREALNKWDEHSSKTQAAFHEVIEAHRALERSQKAQIILLKMKIDSLEERPWQ